MTEHVDIYFGEDDAYFVNSFIIQDTVDDAMDFIIPKELASRIMKQNDGTKVYLTLSGTNSAIWKGSLEWPRIMASLGSSTTLLDKDAILRSLSSSGEKAPVRLTHVTFSKKLNAS